MSHTIILLLMKSLSCIIIKYDKTKELISLTKKFLEKFSINFPALLPRHA